MVLLISIIVSLILFIVWACLKAASDEDERMGYDDIVEEED